jgi:hypothetical protein
VSLDSGGESRIAAEGRRGNHAHRDGGCSGNAPRPACKPSLREALVRADRYRRRGHARELHPPDLRDVRAGGDCGQPRLLHSQPALAGPPAGAPPAARPVKARRLLRGRFRTPSVHSAASGTYRGRGEPYACPACGGPSRVLTASALMRIFPPRCREIRVLHALNLFDFIPGDATNKNCGTLLSKGR